MERGPPLLRGFNYGPFAGGAELPFALLLWDIGLRGSCRLLRLARQVVSFSEGNAQQEILIVLPPFGWVHGTQGTFCAEPRRDRPWMAVLSRAEK